MHKTGLLFKIISALLLIFLLVTGTVLISLLSDQPSVAMPDKLTTDQLRQLQQLLSKNNPANFKARKLNSTILSEPEIKLITTYIAIKTHGTIRLNTKLVNNSLFVQSSFKLPDNPVAEFINFSGDISQTNDKPVIHSLQVNAFQIPDFISRYIMEQTHIYLIKEFSDYRLATQTIKNINFEKHRLTVYYNWQPELASKIKTRLASTLIPDELQSKLILYTSELHKITSSINSQKPSLNELLRQLFNFALERSQHNDPVEENRALFMVLGGYMLNKNIARFMGDNSIKSLPKNHFHLLNRKDLGQHFLISAALTAVSDSGIAHTIGIDKEIKDSYTGSGFSFADLAADQAGIKLATLALGSATDALLIQQRMSQLSHESDYMPDIHNLPEGLQEIDFKLAYQNTDSPAYQHLISEINRRIASCIIYAPPG